jgi:hypothetical protein
MPSRSLALFTSIPPRVSRRDRHGAEIGQTYTERCIKSWLDTGHRVVSVNSAEEIAQLRGRFAGVEFQTVERHAAGIVGRPLVYMSDLLRACAGAPEDIAAIINADLHLDAPDRLAALLPRVDAETLIYAERLDVDDLDDPRTAEPYTYGLDCFLFPPAMVTDIADEGFIFGECWWDYWLPIVLAKRGHRAVLAGPPPFFRHLQHGDGRFGGHEIHYFEGFAAFWRALSVRLPLPGDDPCTVQANACFVTFLRLFNPQLEPAEIIIFLQFLSYVLWLFLHREPELLAALREELVDRKFNHAYQISPRALFDRLLVESEAALGIHVEPAAAGVIR